MNASSESGECATEIVRVSVVVSALTAIKLVLLVENVGVVGKGYFIVFGVYIKQSSQFV